MRSLTVSFGAVGLAGGWLFADVMSASMESPERWLLTCVTPLASALLGHWMQTHGRASYRRLLWLTPIAGALNGLVAGVLYTKSALGVIAALMGIVWALPFLPPLAIVVAAARRVGRARAASILDAADRRRVWSALLGAIALGTMAPLLANTPPAHDPRVYNVPVALSALYGCALGLCVFAAIDARALLRVHRLGARATHARTPMPAMETIDFGMLDDESEEPAGDAGGTLATYREAGSVPRAYRGNAQHAARLLAGHLALDVTSLVLAFAAILARR